MLITFEGIDGCGKTTQLNKLNKYLIDKGFNVVTTFEPGDCDIGKKLREILLNYKGFVADNTELFLYLADRSQHFSKFIKENNDKIILCDRCIDSTIAYQGYGRGYDIDKINFLNDIATNSIKPDLTILFDIDVDISDKRLGKNKDRLENESIEFKNKVRYGFLELAKKYSDRIKVIDASKSIDEVFDNVVKCVMRLF